MKGRFPVGAAFSILWMNLAKLELMQTGLERGWKRGWSATGADVALVRTSRGGRVGLDGRPFELNGAEVEGHAGDPHEQVLRLGQATSVPSQNP